MTLSKAMQLVKNFLKKEEKEEKEVPEPELTFQDMVRRHRHIRKTLLRISLEYEGRPTPRKFSTVSINEDKNTILFYNP